MSAPQKLIRLLSLRLLTSASRVFGAGLFSAENSPPALQRHGTTALPGCPGRHGTAQQQQNGAGNPAPAPGFPGSATSALLLSSVEPNLADSSQIYWRGEASSAKSRGKRRALRRRPRSVPAAVWERDGGGGDRPLLPTRPLPTQQGPAVVWEEGGRGSPTSSEGAARAAIPTSRGGPGGGRQGGRQRRINVAVDGGRAGAGASADVRVVLRPAGGQLHQAKQVS